VFSPELKKGSTEMLILSLLEARALYPTLLRLEDRGLITGRWVEKAGERHRCFYRLTPQGRRALAAHRDTWKAYVEAVNAVLEGGDA
jgi:PadR family transcriptional regulator, regulatory protein PadR